jgi:hypothetical protein
VFKSSIAKILIILLFLKIMLIVHCDDFFIPQFFLASFLSFPKLPLCRILTINMKFLSLNSSNQMTFLAETKCVSSEIRTQFLYIILKKTSL